MGLLDVYNIKYGLVLEEVLSGEQLKKKSFTNPKKITENGRYQLDFGYWGAITIEYKLS